MNIEGSRHERILLVVIAYIIGFITALIAFGIELTGPNTMEVVKAVPRAEVLARQAAVEVDPGVSVRVDADGLHVVRGAEDRILSANRASVIEAFGEVAGNGFHVDVVGTSLSPDDQFVYFCEQLEVNDRDCDPFVYSFASDSAHRVQISGEVITMPIENHDVSWSPGGRLQAQGAVSATLAQPWLLE